MILTACRNSRRRAGVISRGTSPAGGIDLNALGPHGLGLIQRGVTSVRKESSMTPMGNGYIFHTLPLYSKDHSSTISRCCSAES